MNQIKKEFNASKLQEEQEDKKNNKICREVSSKKYFRTSKYSTKAFHKQINLFKSNAIPFCILSSSYYIRLKYYHRTSNYQVKLEHSNW